MRMVLSNPLTREKNNYWKQYFSRYSLSWDNGKNQFPMDKDTTWADWHINGKEVFGIPVKFGRVNTSCFLHFLLGGTEAEDFRLCQYRLVLVHKCTCDIGWNIYFSSYLHLAREPLLEKWKLTSVLSCGFACRTFKRMNPSWTQCSLVFSCCSLNLGEIMTNLSGMGDSVSNELQANR